MLGWNSQRGPHFLIAPPRGGRPRRLLPPPHLSKRWSFPLTPMTMRQNPLPSGLSKRPGRSRALRRLVLFGSVHLQWFYLEPLCHSFEQDPVLDSWAARRKPGHGTIYRSAQHSLLIGVSPRDLNHAKRDARPLYPSCLGSQLPALWPAAKAWLADYPAIRCEVSSLPVGKMQVRVRVCHVSLSLFST